MKSKYYLISYRDVYYRITKEDWYRLTQEQRERFVLEQTKVSISDCLLCPIIDIDRFFKGY